MMRRSNRLTAISPRRSAILILSVLALETQAHAFDPPVAIPEGAGPGPWGQPCPLSTVVNGTCGNYRWFNVCSGYIWLYSGWKAGEGVGVLFGGPQQPCVDGGSCDENTQLKRVIYYFRNAQPGYPDSDRRVRLSLDTDQDGDGCPEFTIASIAIEPSERWNCWELGGCGVPDRVIARQVQLTDHGPSFATDGPHAEECAPTGAPQSFYYGINGSVCQPWVGPAGRRDNFLIWLIYDNLGWPDSVEPTTWGRIKGLFE